MGAEIHGGSGVQELVPERGRDAQQGRAKPPVWAGGTFLRVLIALGMGEGSSKGCFWLACTLGDADLGSVAALGHGHDATRHKGMLPLSHTRDE